MIADEEREEALMTARVCETSLRSGVCIAIVVRHRRLDQAYRKAITGLISDSMAASAMLKTSGRPARAVARVSSQSAATCLSRQQTAQRPGQTTLQMAGQTHAVLQNRQQ